MLLVVWQQEEKNNYPSFMRTRFDSIPAAFAVCCIQPDVPRLQTIIVSEIE